MSRSLVALLALLAVARLDSPALAQTCLKPGGFGDRIDGDVHTSSESDLFVSQAVAGSRLVLSLRSGPGRAYLAGFDVYYYDEHTGITKVGFFGGEPTPDGTGFESRVAVLPSTGRYGMLVFAGGQGRTGEYVLSSSIKPPARPAVAFVAPGAEADAEASFDALPGTIASIKVRAAKDTPLPATFALVDADGVEVTTSAKVGPTSAALTSAALPKLGRYTLRIDGEGAATATVTVKLKPPRAARRRLDVRDIVAPEPPVVDLGVVNGSTGYAMGIPLIGLADEKGGCEGLRFYLAQRRPQFLVDTGFPSDLASREMDKEYDGDGRLAGYRVEFYYRATGDVEPTWGAAVSGITYDDEDRLTGFSVTARTPEGEGQSAFSLVTRDESGRITSFLETRTYGTVGNPREWSLAVHDMFYLDNVLAVFRVTATGPGVTGQTFRHPHWVLP